MGKANAVTIRDLAGELLPIRANADEIRWAIMELLLEGFPIVIFPELKLYFAESQEEIDESLEQSLEEICF